MKYDALRWPESQQRTTNRKSAMFKTSRALYSNGFRGLTVSDAITRICGEVFAIADGEATLTGHFQFGRSGIPISTRKEPEEAR